MGATTLFGIPTPELTDDPNGPAQMLALAAAVDARLGRAIPCLSTARPPHADGRLIRETDTGAIRMSDGENWTQDLRAGTGEGGGGGGGSTAGKWAQYSAASAQSIPNTQDVACKFETADSTDAAVVRAAKGAGHQFTLKTSGIWTVSTSVRYAESSAVGERYAGIHWASNPTGADGADDPLAGQSTGTNGKGATSLNVAVTRWFDTDDAVFVSLWQGTGGTRQLEPGEGGAMGKGWVRINFALVAT